jgi:CDP-diacylglycerol--serine O-phosphatidyltransferase
VLLPLYLDGLGLFDVRAWPWLIAIYTLVVALMLVSTIPTFSGKLMGERIPNEYILPLFVGAATGVALLITYPYGVLTLLSLLYLVMIPVSYRRFDRKLSEPVAAAAAQPDGTARPGTDLSHPESDPANQTKH